MESFMHIYLTEVLRWIWSLAVNCREHPTILKGGRLWYLEQTTRGQVQQGQHRTIRNTTDKEAQNDIEKQSELDF